MKEKPAVFFETLRRMDWPRVVWHLARGRRIFVFDFTYQLKKFRWLRRLIHQERVVRLYVHHASKADGLAIDAAEWLYPKFATHPFVRAMAGLYGEREVAPLFKHAIALNAHRYFYTRLTFSRARELEEIPSEILLVSETFKEWDRLLSEWCSGKIPPMEGVRVIWKSRPVKAFYYAGWYAKLAFCLFVVRIGKRVAQREPDPSVLRAEYAVSITSRFLADFSSGRRFDFLLGDGGLDRENTVFIVSPEADGPWVERQRSKGYRIVRQIEYASVKGLLRYPPRRLDPVQAARAIACGVTRLNSADWLHQAFSSGLRVLLQECSLLERIQPRAYVYANRYWLDPRWRNALIRRLGGASWWYAYSSGGAYTREEGGPFASNEDFGGRHRFWSYENADHFVSPCRPLIDYYQKHRQTIRQYHDIGNIWSEAILETSAAVQRSGVLGEWFRVPLEGRKILAWFDSSFVEARNSPSTFTEAIAWYADLLRLADEEPDFLMVVKPSKESFYYTADDPDQQWSDPRVGKRLLQVWEALKAHPRIRFLDRRTDPSLVIAVSDLTITFPYTSVSAEALGARKRAIWYEPGERWRNTLYARLPDLVAHGYPELRARTGKLLRETSDSEYDRFLETTAKGPVESFLDGKAISRFRALLFQGVRIP